MEAEPIGGTLLAEGADTSPDNFLDDELDEDPSEARLHDSSFGREDDVVRVVSPRRRNTRSLGCAVGGLAARHRSFASYCPLAGRCSFDERWRSSLAVRACRKGPQPRRQGLQRVDANRGERPLRSHQGGTPSPASLVALVPVAPACCITLRLTRACSFAQELGCVPAECDQLAQKVKTKTKHQARLRGALRTAPARLIKQAPAAARLRVPLSRFGQSQAPLT